MSKVVRVWVDLPEELEVALKAAARRRHLTRDQGLRQAVEEYVRHEVDGLPASDDLLPPEPADRSPTLRRTRGIATMALVRQVG